MHTARDPALFLSIYLLRQSLETEDARATILRQVDAFADLYKLETDDSLHPQASSIDLRKVDGAPAEYTKLFQAKTKTLDAPAGTFYEVVIYTYHDTIVVQIQITKFRDWRGSLVDGWQQLASQIRAGFGTSLQAGAESSTFGVSAVYWVITDHNACFDSYKADVRRLSEGSDVRRTETDLGLLWYCDRPFFSNVGIHQDLWVLTTPRESEEEVNKRYYQPVVEGPPDFGEVALARHKIFFEISQHGSVRRDLERRAKVLEKQTFSFLAMQRRLGSQLDELASDTAIDFEQRLSRATNHLAAYRNRIGQLKELRRTIDVNRRNYLLHCLRLISVYKLKQVEHSMDRERAARNILAKMRDDEIFVTDLGTIAQHYQQLETDIGYSESTADRHTLALRSATDQLRIAGEREIAEMARHLAVDSAAVVASVATLVVVELADKRHTEAIAKLIEKGGGYHYQLESWFLVGWVILGVYGLTQALGARLRGRKPGAISIVAAFGLASLWLSTVLLNHPQAFQRPRSSPLLLSKWLWAVVIAGFLGSTVVGHIVYRLAWLYARTKRKKNLRMRRSQV